MGGGACKGGESVCVWGMPVKVEKVGGGGGGAVKVEEEWGGGPVKVEKVGGGGGGGL